MKKRLHRAMILKDKGYLKRSPKVTASAGGRFTFTIVIEHLYCKLGIVSNLDTIQTADCQLRK